MESLFEGTQYVLITLHISFFAKGFATPLHLSFAYSLQSAALQPAQGKGCHFVLSNFTNALHSLSLQSRRGYPLQSSCIWTTFITTSYFAEGYSGYPLRTFQQRSCCKDNPHFPSAHQHASYPIPLTPRGISCMVYQLFAKHSFATTTLLTP